jgi:hypothetical protein
MALHYSLEKRGALVIQVHSLKLDVISKRTVPQSWAWAHNNIIRFDRPCQVIIIVRDPLRMMITEFFSKLKWLTGNPRAVWDLTVEQLCELFRDVYIEKDKRHRVLLDWYEREVEGSLGINVYEMPFPDEARFVEFQHGNKHVLILRTEIDDVLKGRIVGDFARIPNLEIVRFNTSEQKGIGAISENFRAQLKLPRHQLEEIYESRFAQHFISPEERQQAIEQYLLVPPKG